MIYRIISVRSTDAPKRFYRKLLVREDLGLEELGCVILTSLRGTYSHYFLFRSGDKYYAPDAFLDNFRDFYEPMKSHTLDDLGEDFVFEYDTGDGWEFRCHVYKKTVEKDGDFPGYFVDGAGQGIWEDNRWSLLAYLDGEISGELHTDDEGTGYRLPWNFDNKSFSDFDAPLNIEEEKKAFESSILNDINDWFSGSEEAEEDDPEEDRLYRVLDVLTENIMELMDEDDELKELFASMKDIHGFETALSAFIQMYYVYMGNVVVGGEDFDRKAFKAEMEGLLKQSLN